MSAAGGQEPPALSDEAAQTLLELACETVTASVRGLPLPAIPEMPELAAHYGVFVSLHEKGALRGCLGHVEADLPLGEATRRMAVAAARDDPRFVPVTPDELADLGVEVSVLSPLVKVPPEVIVPGRDGVMVRHGGRVGLLLPQVAEEHRWDQRTLLRQVCAKAALPPEAWRDPGTDVFAFQATLIPARTRR